LRRERERLGLSLADVAERAKIDKAALSRLENGHHFNPTVSTLARYVHALGKSLAWGMTEDFEKRTVEKRAASEASLVKNEDVLNRVREPRRSEKKKKSTQ